MRLTLRTLLAYLDDRLSPANARELGQKLAASPLATELADRIRAVVRRRRLADDAARQKTIDANLIAEYLDDQLTPELVALIEKEILASDHSLAEVAATHQILGLLSDPVEIESGLKDRLYLMDPAAEESNGEADGVPLNGTAAGWQPLVPQLEPTKRSPMILLAVMVLGWLGLLATDASLFDSRPHDTADEAPRVDNAERGPVLAANGDQVAPERAASRPTTIDEPTEVPAAAAVTSVNDMPADSAEAATPPGPGSDTLETSEVAAPVPSTDTPLPVETSEPAAPPKTPDAETSAPPAPKSQQLHLTDTYAMTVVSDPDTAEWQWATSLGDALDWNSVLKTRVVGITEPYAVVVRNHKAGWSAVVHGSSLFAAQQADATGIRLYDGRIVLQRSAAAGLNLKPVPVGVGGRLLHISLPTEQQRIGIHVVPFMAATPPPPHADHDEGTTTVDNQFPLLPLTNPCVVFIFAAEGDVVLRADMAEDSVTIRRGHMLQWDTNTDTFPDGVAAQTTIIPDWVMEPADPQTDATKALLSELALGFQKNVSVSSAALTLSDHRNPQIAAYAMKVPVLLRSVNDLATTLMQSESQVVRREAITGLQQILYQFPTGAARIRAALEIRLTEASLEDAMRLLEGVTRTAAEDPDVSEWLVGMLENQRVALRELAIFNLEQVTGENHGFFASDASGRVAAVRSWRRILSRNEGRLVAPTE